MIPGIDPKIDYAFKRLFGMERNRALLIHIINAILKWRKQPLITELDILNPFNDKETSDDKLSVVDLRARDSTGRQFNVEMQMLAHLALPERLLYYLSRFHSQQMREGEAYSELQPTLTICFLDDLLFPEVPDYHLCFSLREDNYPALVLSSHLQVHLFELPKFQLAVDALDDELQKWLYFMRHAATLDSEVLPATMRVPEIQQALEELTMVTQSERDRARYEERFKAEMDARNFPAMVEATVRKKVLAEGLEQGRQLGIEQGRELGIEQGREQGRQIGELIGMINLCQGILRQRRTPHEDLLKLPLPELQLLADRLKLQLESRVGSPNGK